LRELLGFLKVCPELLITQEPVRLETQLMPLQLRKGSQLQLALNLMTGNWKQGASVFENKGFQ
jgi:hypothetical protein